MPSELAGKSGLGPWNGMYVGSWTPLTLAAVLLAGLPAAEAAALTLGLATALAETAADALAGAAEAGALAPALVGLEAGELTLAVLRLAVPPQAARRVAAPAATETDKKLRRLNSWRSGAWTWLKGNANSLRYEKLTGS